MVMANKYNGTCSRCGQHVPAGAGKTAPSNTGWRVYCIPECEERPKHVAQGVIGG